MDWIVFSAVVSSIGVIGGLVVAVVKLWLQVKKEKKDAKANREAAKEILDQAVALRKALDDKETKIQQLEKRIDELYKVVPEARTADILVQKRTELAQRKLDMQNEREQWNRLVAVAKGIGWILDRVRENEED